MTLFGGIAQIPLILPLALCVLYLGYQRWKPNKSFKNVTHSEFFTYNMALTQLLNISGTVTNVCGLYTSSDAVARVGDYLYGAHFITELLFHSLTCVDRYLAIVKPILYLKLKQRLGIVVRNVLAGVVWLLYLGYIGLQQYYYPSYPITVLICTLIVMFHIISFCSVSVLCVLLRPGPGGTGQKKIDQSKLKAFQTIMAIMVVVLIWVLGIFVVIWVENTVKINLKVHCVLFEMIVWLSLPTSAVLLVLYLQRTSKFNK
ncbi:hypothetical protein NQD34_013452 [Periophthalmus magnuspinnatus]|nr:hypothetical protein NQD34_013452 [Periophthalmus magnuspinnatus]